MSGAAPLVAPASRRWRLWTAIAVAAVIALRCPGLLVTPRLWAEEGSVYFAAAQADGFWATLFLPHLGYLNLLANVAAGLASLAPLECAPMIATWIAFAVQLVTGVTAMAMVRAGGGTPVRALVFALATQLLASGEVWLTTICSQYWLGALAYLVLRDERPDRGESAPGARILLLVAGLSSVQACFMTPLFYLQARRTRARARMHQCAVLALATLIQVAAMLVSWCGADAGLLTRFRENHFSLGAAMFDQVLAPVVGYELLLLPSIVDAEAAFRSLTESWFGAGVAAALPPLRLLAGFVLVVAPCLLLLAAGLRRPSARQAWLAWPFLVVLSILGSQRFAGGLRYAFTPTIALAVLVMDETRAGVPRWRRVLAWGLAGAALLSSGLHFTTRVYWDPAMPRWPDEVAAWRADPSHALRIWPEGWKVQLRR